MRCVAIEVAIYRIGKFRETGPEQQFRKNGKETGKWPQARNGRKMAIKMEKWTRKCDFGLILAIFSVSVAIFSAISGVRPFSIFFPIFRGFLLRASFPVCKSLPLQSQALRADKKGTIDFVACMPRQASKSGGGNAILWTNIVNPEPLKYEKNCLATNFLSDSTMFPTPN